MASLAEAILAAVRPLRAGDRITLDALVVLIHTQSGIDAVRTSAWHFAAFLQLTLRGDAWLVRIVEADDVDMQKSYVMRR